MGEYRGAKYPQLVMGESTFYFLYQNFIAFQNGSIEEEQLHSEWARTAGDWAMHMTDTRIIHNPQRSITFDTLLQLFFANHSWSFAKLSTLPERIAPQVIDTIYESILSYNLEESERLSTLSFA